MKMRIILGVLIAVAVVMMSCASAETMTEGNYTFTIPDSLEELEGWDDPELICCYGNDTLELQLYSFDAEGTSIKEYMAEFAEEVESEVQTGDTNINGVDCVYLTFTGSDDMGEYIAVCYAMEDGDKILQFDFYLEDESANETVLEIMNSLQKK